MCASAHLHPPKPRQVPQSFDYREISQILEKPLPRPGLWEGEALPAIGLVSRRLSLLSCWSLPGENGHGGAHVLVPEMAHLEKQGAEKLMVCALLHGPLTPSLVPSR